MKLPKIAAPVREYELTYLLPVSFTDSELGKMTAEIEAVLKKHKAEDISTANWGKKKMAYGIKHAGTLHTDANYYHVTFKVGSDHTQDLEKDVYLQPRVIRHLLVLAEEMLIPPGTEVVVNIAPDRIRTKRGKKKDVS
jgi:small subunit ribosomal protein S6